MRFDILLQGGRLCDGTGNPWRRADVGIAAGKIATVGRLDRSEADLVIDVGDRVVAPGFIDAHVHLDSTLLAEPDGEPLLAQGITTVILGQDGLGFAPAGPAAMAYVADYTAPFNPPVDLWQGACAEGGLSVDGYLRLLDQRTAVNVGYLLPHGTIRYTVMGGDDRPPSPAELERMRALVRQGMAEGALGLSTGLEYVPGMFARTGELIALCRDAAAGGGLYVTHMRSYGPAYAEAVAEVAEIARAAGLPAHISHYNLPAAKGLPLIDALRHEGVDVTFDTYPYLAGSTVLSYFLPGWASEGGVEATLARLGAPAARDGLRPAIESGVDWELVRLAFVPGEINRHLEGLSVGEAARQRAQALTEFVCDLLVEERLCVGVVALHAHRSEADLQAMLRHPAQMVGSDGIYRGGRPHPRGWGAFSRVLARYVREERVLTLEDAVRRMSAHPAARFGLADRGLVRAGYAADVIVFDPNRVTDRATFEQGRQIAEGIDLVIVNGRVVWREGAPQGEMAGRALRRCTGLSLEESAR